MRILWASNAPHVGSGYGVQTAQVVSRLKAAGHEVAVAANFGVNGTTMGWNGIPVFPPGLDAYGQDVIPPLHAKWSQGTPTLVITLFDVWVYKDPAIDELPLASWVPIDHVQVPEAVLAFARKHPVIAMSRFGHRALAEAGVQAHYVPHAIERSVFRPVETGIRSALGIPPDAFLVLINAANKGNVPPRKAWGEMLAAYSIIAQRHPDAYLYLNTDLVGHNGVPLIPLMALRGIDPTRVRITPQPEYRTGAITSPMVNELYNAADVLLASSMGEGFGVPVVEAQAAGCPVIVSDVTAQPELCGAGWTAATQRYYDITQGADFGMPLIDSVVEALEAAYQARGDLSLRAKAVEFAAQYDADRVFAEHWVPVLRELEHLVSPPTRQTRRAQARRKKAAA